MNPMDRARAQFAFEGEFREAEELHAGHINNTYHLSFALPDGETSEYVLQRINTYVFKNPEAVMENVLRVTRHLRRKYRERGIDSARRVLHMVRLRDGGWLYTDPDGGCWRAYRYISGTVGPERVESPAQFREVGRGFGVFQAMLSDFPADELNETIPKFHDTRSRYDALEAAIAADPLGRAAGVRAEIEYLRGKRESLCRIIEMLEAGEIPTRVTHNDTKINNVMMDVATGEAMCVIDLDTVMPGTLLWDFGDAIRFGASTAAEDEPDTSKIALDMELFEAFTEGFLAGLGEHIEPGEARLLPLGAAVMTGEVGVRFLTDYIDGDRYFKIDYPEHNLVRARSQIAILKDMDRKWDDMAEVVRRCMAGI